MQYLPCSVVGNDAHVIVLHYISHHISYHISHQIKHHISTFQVEKCKALSGIAGDALSLLSLFYSGIDRSLGDLFTDVDRGRVGNPATNGVVNAKSSTPNRGIVEKECFLTYSNSNGKYIEQAVAMCRSAISDTSSLPLSASIHLKQ